MMQDQAASSSQSASAAGSLPPINEASAEQYSQVSQYRRADPREDIRYDTYYRSDNAAQLAKALGWFSIGLGLAQVLAPGGVSRLIGVQHHPRLLRTLGARELVNGIGILSQRRPFGWLWTRLAGDAVDLALLGWAARTEARGRGRLGLATAAVAGVAVLDLISSMDNTERARMEQGLPPSPEVHVKKSIAINRSADECYQAWRDFEHFPRFMQHLESVQIIGDNLMHWKAKGPAGTSIEWNAELTADEPGRHLAWRSVEGSDVDTTGFVHFEQAPGGRGAIVRVDMHYSPPGGRAGVLVAKMFGEEPAQQIDEDLRRFKWLMETGEVPTTIGQPSGTRGVMGRLFRKGAPG